MNPRTEPQAKKPRLAVLLATGFGLGHLPKAPGTWGSLGGLALVWALAALARILLSTDGFLTVSLGANRFVASASVIVLWLQTACAVVVAAVGVWAASRAANHFGGRDPQVVVIDEVSGQELALVAGLAAPNWKYFLLGLILFRVFDIAKPFPARRAEKLPGGWGIMADDWVAGIYAALGLWLARGLGF